jgi:DNA-binding SARP family transcriptional activator
VAVELLLLGPVEVAVAGRTVPIGHPKHRAVLAALGAELNRTVPAERLISRVWSDDPPKTARNLLSGYVAGLRAALAAAPGADGSVRVRRGAGGYLLSAEPDRVDLHRFRARVEQARAGHAADPAAAVPLLDAALAEWRGEAIADIAGGWADGLRHALAQERLAARVLRNDAMLRAGRHAELLHDLRAAVDADPADERLRGQLVLALYRAGQPAAALAAYAEARRWLAEELGLDPGPELRELERRVLSNDPALAAPAEPDSVPVLAPSPSGHVPRQLPGPTGGFAGRGSDLAALDALFAPVLSGTAAATQVVAISGAAGVGKTALALEWARRVRHAFDGDLYVHLRGHSDRGSARSPADVLPFLLRALDVPPDGIPEDADDMAAAFRTALAGRRALLVLDDAAGPEQIRPLLPGTAGSAVVVTSRSRLTGMAARDGIALYPLDVLSTVDAVGLVRGILAGRPDVDDDAIAGLVAACGRLPLALRIAAAQLAETPEVAVRDYVTALTGSRGLAVLEIADDPEAAVRRAFGLSYQRLPVPVAALFRMLALVPGQVTTGAAAALAGVPEADAAAGLAALRDVHLLEPAGPGRYTMHDLLRRYARELLSAAEPPVAAAAWQRLLDWHLAATVAAARLLYRPPLLDPPDTAATADPPFTDAAGARDWLDAERVDLVSLGVRAAQDGPAGYAWLLLDALMVDLRVSRHLGEWRTLASAAYSAARAANDHSGQIVALLGRAGGAFASGRHADALDDYEVAARLAGEVGWVRAESIAISDAGMVFWTTGRLDEAALSYERARELDRDDGYQLGEFAALNNLGIVSWELGRLAESLAQYRRALQLADTIGAAPDQVGALLVNMALAYRDLGQLPEALDAARRAVALAEDRWARAVGLDTLASVEAYAGMLGEALGHSRTAGELAEIVGDLRVQVDTWNTLGLVQRLSGVDGEAAAAHRAALAAARGIEYRRGEVEALLGLATVESSVDLAREALRIASVVGFSVLAAVAYEVLGALTGDQSYARVALELRLTFAGGFVEGGAEAGRSVPGGPA